MSRVGREPTEDVKRRIVAACEEVGLDVSSARMYKLTDAGVRVVNVEASLSEWPYESPTVSVLAKVALSGSWPEFVQVFCCGSEDDPLAMRGPWMKGREQVQLGELVSELQETLQEREQVVAAVKMGVPGPYKFTRSVWERVDLLRGLDCEQGL